ncbi:hypothetical protein [Marmoricola sp. URHA0025 HA25]
MPATEVPSRPPATNEDSSTKGRERRLLLLGRLALGYALVVTLLPIKPTMPELGLDASWKIAINRATAEGLQFGHDIVFTYGPLAGVVSGVYEPGIRTLVFGAALVLAAGFVTAALLAFSRLGGIFHLVAALGIVTLTSLPAEGLDGLVLLYPMVVVSAVRNLPERRRARLLLVVLLAAPFGLLPSVKLSIVPALAAGLAAAAVLLVRRRDWPALGLLAVVPLVNLALWWRAAHQSLSGLVDYVHNSWYVVAGYSEAMSVHEVSRLSSGAGTPIFVFGAAILLAGAIATRHDVDSLIEAGMVAVTLFLAFKSGFVRADLHMQSGALALLAAAAMVLPGGNGTRLRRGVVTAGVAAAALTCYLSGPVSSPLAAVGDQTVRLASAAASGDLSSSSLDRHYAAALRSIREQASIPEAVGRSDLYTSSLSLLFAQGATWDPRPVIQSYAAYTPELARLNARHLAGRDAPRTVFYQVAPIDFRLPALEDGASWLPLLENYSVSPESSAYLVLHRRAAPAAVVLGASTHVIRARIGARVDLPAEGTSWLASFDVKGTMLGKLRNALWKPPQLRIAVQTADGRTAVRRFVPAMARSEFILSPYVADTAGLQSLFPGQPADPGKQVTSIRLLADSSTDLHFWQKDYSLRLRSLVVSPQ